MLQPHIRIWNSVSLTTNHIIGTGEFDGAICCLSFSKADGGNLLCAIDETSDHNISIWDWQKGDRGMKLTETKVRILVPKAVRNYIVKTDHYNYSAPWTRWFARNGTHSRGTKSSPAANPTYHFGLSTTVVCSIRGWACSRIVTNRNTLHA